jgi:hypothetical protein
MSLTVSAELIAATVNPSFDKSRVFAKNLRDDREIRIDASELDADGLADLIAAATSVGDAKTVRAVESIAQARAGDFGKPVPNFKAFQGVVEAFLKSNLIDGWIYVEGSDGKMYPELMMATPMGAVSPPPRFASAPPATGTTGMGAQAAFASIQMCTRSLPRTWQGAGWPISSLAKVCTRKPRLCAMRTRLAWSATTSSHSLLSPSSFASVAWSTGMRMITTAVETWS